MCVYDFSDAFFSFPNRSFNFVSSHFPPIPRLLYFCSPWVPVKLFQMCSYLLALKDMLRWHPFLK